MNVEPKLGRKKSSTNDDNALNVSLTVKETLKLKGLEQDCGIFQTFIGRIFKKEKCHPYKWVY